MTDPTPPRLGKKLTGFALISGMTSGKSGVDNGHIHPSPPRGDAPGHFDRSARSHAK